MPRPPFGSPVMFGYLRVVRKIDPCSPLLEFGQKIWAAKRTESEWRPVSFFGLHLNLDRRTDWIWVKTFFLSSSFWSSSFSPFYLFKFLATRLAPFFENPAYATTTGVSNLYPLGPIRPAISNFQIPHVTSEVVGHATKSHSETTPTFDETFFFLRVLNYKSAKNYLKIWWIPFLLFFSFMIPKHARLNSNGVKIAIFCENSQTSHKMTTWPRATAAYLQILVCDILSCISLFRASLKWHVFDQIFLKLGFNPPFSSAWFSPRRSIFAQINGLPYFWSRNAKHNY